MNDDAKLKWLVRINTEIEMMNYELDEELYKHVVWVGKDDMEYCVCLHVLLTILDEDDHLVFFLC